MVIDQETRWLNRYNEVKGFLEENHRNPSELAEGESESLECREDETGEGREV